MGALGRKMAVECLLLCVYEKLEHLNPSNDREWPELGERNLYRIVVRGLLDRTRLLRAALGWPPPNNDMVDRCP